MKKSWKRVLSIILAVTLMVAVCVPAFAGVKKKPVVPVIHVQCYGGSEVYNYDGSEMPAPLKENEVEFYAALAVVIAKIAEQMNVPGAPFDKSAFIDDMARAAELMTYNCDENGDPMYESACEEWPEPLENHMDRYEGEDMETMCGGWAFETQVGDTIGYDKVYMFRYDSRLDTLETADKLDAFIQVVKEQTGSDKVSLVGDSQGGLTMASYFYKYMDKEDVENAVFVDGAQAGVSVTQMFTGDFTVDADGLTDYLICLAKTVEDGRYETLITMVVWLLQYQIHTLASNMSDLGEDEELLEDLFLKVFKPILGNVPIMYEFLPYDQFDAAVEWLSSIGYLDKTSGLYKKILRYHKAQGQLTKTMQSLAKYGINAAVFANYGQCNIPVTSAYQKQTDVLIDTEYASVYATVADKGEVLPITEGEYLSPDRVIDASTCALPNQTWFIRDVMHTIFNYGYDPMNLMCDILLGYTKPTLEAVYKKYGYTQFMKVDNPDDQNLINITEEDMPETEG